MGGSGWSGLGDVAEMTGRDLQGHRQGLLGLVLESAGDVQLGRFFTYCFAKDYWEDSRRLRCMSKLGVDQTVMAVVNNRLCLLVTR